MVSVDNSLEKRVATLEGDLKRLKSSQIIGGDNITGFSQTVKMTTPVATYSNIWGGYLFNMQSSGGNETGYQDQSYRIHYLDEVTMGFIRPSRVTLRRSDGRVISEFTIQSTGRLKAPTGEDIEFAVYENLRSSYLWFDISVIGVAYAGNTVSYTIEIELEKNYNRDVIVE